MFLIILALSIIILLILINSKKKINVPAFKCIEPERCINARYNGYDPNLSYDYQNYCPANCIDKQKVVENRIVKVLNCPNGILYLND